MYNLVQSPPNGRISMDTRLCECATILRKKHGQKHGARPCTTVASSAHAAARTIALGAAVARPGLADCALCAQRPHTAAVGGALRNAAAATLATLVTVQYLQWELGSILRQRAGRNRQWVGSSARMGA